LRANGGGAEQRRGCESHDDHGRSTTPKLVQGAHTGAIDDAAVANDTASDGIGIDL